MSDIFSEVDEDVRKDKSVLLWNKYGKYVIGASVLVVAVTASVVGWKNYQTTESRAQGKIFEQAAALSADSKYNESALIFSELSKTGSAGYQALAQLRQASALIAAGKGAEALEVYDALAASTDADEEFTSIARILAGYYLINNGSTSDVRDRVSGLENAGTLWSASAKELLALSDLKDGKLDSARTLFKELQDDATAPAGAKQRAGQVIEALKNR